MTDIFDGEAVSQADREFLTSLGDHPLVRNPLYGARCSPQPDFEPYTREDKERYNELFAERRTFFSDVVVPWMLANYAYYKGAFVGKGGVISLVDGEITSLASLRGLMQPYALLSIGPKGGLKTTSAVDAWMMHSQRAQIDAIQTSSDRPRPVFTEDDYTIFNRYRPPVHPADGGDITPFEAFFARLVPDEAERT